MRFLGGGGDELFTVITLDLASSAVSFTFLMLFSVWNVCKSQLLVTLMCTNFNERNRKLHSILPLVEFHRTAFY